MTEMLMLQFEWVEVNDNSRDCDITAKCVDPRYIGHAIRRNRTMSSNREKYQLVVTVVVMMGIPSLF